MKTILIFFYQSVIKCQFFLQKINIQIAQVVLIFQNFWSYRSSAKVQITTDYSVFDRFYFHCVHYCRMLLTQHYNQRTFDETVCDALIANGDVKNVKKGAKCLRWRSINHSSDFSYVCDAEHTVSPFELFAMRQNNRNGQPYQCVCDIWHIVRSNELFAIRECNKNG